MASRKRPVSKYHKIWYVYLYNCKRRKIPYGLSADQVERLVTQHCFYCDAPPSNKRAGLVYSGIDRKDNAKGYTMANCVPCCIRCNAVKGNKLSFEQMCAVGRTLRVLDAVNKPK